MVNEETQSILYRLIGWLRGQIGKEFTFDQVVERVDGKPDSSRSDGSCA